MKMNPALNIIFFVFFYLIFFPRTTHSISPDPTLSPNESFITPISLENNIANSIAIQNDDKFLATDAASLVVPAIAVHSDFNQDGYQDVAVGVPGEDIDGIINTGAVQVFYGGQGGIATTNQLWHLNSPGVPLSLAANDRFGATVATGDFNGDTYIDLAIGIPFKDSTKGRVVVLYGGTTGLSSTGSQVWDQDSLQDTREGDDRFGSALTTGDFNADGYADLAIGVPGEDFPDVGPPTNPGSICSNGICANAGIVNLVYGSALGLTATHNELWHQDRGGGYDGWVEWQDCFGSSLAAGDFDGDGADDLAVGVPCEHTGGADIPGRNLGAVSVYYGKSGVGLGGSGAQYLRQLMTGIVGEPQPNDALGYALAAADFNGNGFDDLAVGVPGEGADITGGEDAGAVAIFYGVADTGLSAHSASQNELLSRHAVGLGGGTAGARWGTALAVGNFNADGFPDLAVGAPLDNVDNQTDAGSVSILFGKASGISRTGNQLISQNTANVENSAKANDWFGQMLIAGDFNGNGVSDLAVGVPFEDVGGKVSSGAVNVLYGVNNIGISALNDLFLHQDSPSAQDAVETGDRFGERIVPKLYANPWPSEPL